MIQETGIETRAHSSVFQMDFDSLLKFPDEENSRPRRKPNTNGGGGNGGNRSNLESLLPRIIIPLVALLFLLPLIWPFVLVGAGERAVIFNRFSGVQPGQLGEGLHAIIPWVQSATVYDVKAQTYTMSGSATEANQQAGNSNDALLALTADGQPVSLEMSVRYHVDPQQTWKLHQEIGPDYLSKVVRPEVRSDVRMIIAQYPVVDVYGPKRADIIAQIDSRLRRELARNYVVLDEALLRDVSFSPQFQQAVEQKQVAQQDVARMAYERDRAEKERRRKIIEAEGEAESIRLKASALAANPGLTQYEYVQRLPGNVKTVVTDDKTIVNLGDLPASTVVAADDSGNAPSPAPTAAAGQ